MTPFPYSVELDDPLETATTLMAEHDIRHVPVKDRHEIVGVLTQRDLASAMDLRAAEAANPESLHIRDFRLGDAYVVDLTAPLQRVTAEMAARHIDSAIVVKDGRLAGIFTATDACRVLGAILRQTFPPPGRGEAA